MPILTYINNSDTSPLLLVFFKSDSSLYPLCSGVAHYVAYPWKCSLMQILGVWFRSVFRNVLNIYDGNFYESS